MFFQGLCLRKKDAIVQKKEEKHHMPDVCRAYDAYEAYEVYTVMASMIVLMVSRVSSKVMSFA